MSGKPHQTKEPDYEPSTGTSGGILLPEDEPLDDIELDALQNENLVIEIRRAAHGVNRAQRAFKAANKDTTTTCEAAFAEADKIFAHDNDMLMAGRAILLRIARAISRHEEASSALHACIGRFFSEADTKLTELIVEYGSEAQTLKARLAKKEADMASDNKKWNAQFAKYQVKCDEEVARMRKGWEACERQAGHDYHAMYTLLLGELAMVEGETWEREERVISKLHKQLIFLQETSVQMARQRATETETWRDKVREAESQRDELQARLDSYDKDKELELEQVRRQVAVARRERDVVEEKLSEHLDTLEEEKQRQQAQVAQALAEKDEEMRRAVSKVERLKDVADSVLPKVTGDAHKHLYFETLKPRAKPGAPVRQPSMTWRGSEEQYEQPSPTASPSTSSPGSQLRLQPAASKWARKH